MAHKVGSGDYSAYDAHQTAQKNMLLNYDKNSLDECKERINEIAQKGGLGCHCNLPETDVRILKKAGFSVEKDVCLDPYSDSNAPANCYSVFWRKGRVAENT